MSSQHDKHEKRSERLFRGLIGSRGASVEAETDEVGPVCLSSSSESEEKSPETSRLGFRDRMSKWRVSRNITDRSQSLETMDSKEKDKDKDKHAATSSLSGGLIAVRSAEGEDEGLVFSLTGKLMGGSAEDLLKYVQRLVSGSEEAVVFAFTHTLFMTETKLLETLLGSLLHNHRQQQPASGTIASAEKLRARRVTNFLKTWIGTNNRWQKAELLDIVNHYMEQYAVVPDLVNDARILRDFIAQQQQQQASESIAVLRAAAQQRLSLSDYRNVPVSSGGSSRSAARSILDHDINTLAAQLTALEQTFFQLVDVEQILDAPPGKASAVPSLQPWTEHAFSLALWVRWELRNGGTLKTRVLDRFVHLAAALRELGNFGTAFQIVLALKSISFVVRSKDRLDATTQKLFAELSSWTSSTRHYHVYREMLSKKITRPKLPYLHITIGDIERACRMPTFQQDTPTDVNWLKMKKLGRAFIEIVRSQEVPFALPFCQDLLQWIHSSPAIDVSDVQDVSDPTSSSTTTTTATTSSSSSSPSSSTASDEDHSVHPHGNYPSGSQACSINISVSSSSAALNDQGRSPGTSPSSPSEQDATSRISQILRRRETRKQAEVTKEGLERETKQAKSSVKKKLINSAAFLQQVMPYLDVEELEQAPAVTLLAVAPNASIEEVALAVRSVVGFNEMQIEDEVLCSLEEWQSNTERAATLGKSLSDCEQSLGAVTSDREKSMAVQEGIETELAACLGEITEQLDGWTNSPDSQCLDTIGQMTKQMIELLSSTAHLEK